MGSSEKVFRIGSVAPGTRMSPNMAHKASELVKQVTDGRAELVFHPQCFRQAGHFAGTDEERIAALVEVANDPGIDAVWLARGGYGACRVAELAIPQMSDAARAKKWLGYSDAGFLLAGLYKAGFKHLAHGPMPVDLIREDGEQAMKRGLAWLFEDASWPLEKGTTPGHPNLAFNLTIFSQLLGTPLEPDLKGHVLMLEDVGEYMYRIDRYFYHVTSNPNVRACAGIRLGRCSAVPKNDLDFELTEEEIARFWCDRSGIPYLGRADIGHDSENKVVPFG